MSHQENIFFGGTERKGGRGEGGAGGDRVGQKEVKRAGLGYSYTPFVVLENENDLNRREGDGSRLIKKTEGASKKKKVRRDSVEGATSRKFGLKISVEWGFRGTVSNLLLGSGNPLTHLPREELPTSIKT